MSDNATKKQISDGDGTETAFMNNTRRGLPLTRSHHEQIFPKLTPAQICRIMARM